MANQTFTELPTMGYLRQSQLIPHIIPISSATLWRMVKAGKFPQPLKISQAVTCWKAEEVRDWIEAKNAEVPL